MDILDRHVDIYKLQFCSYYKTGKKGIIILWLKAFVAFLGSTGSNKSLREENRFLVLSKGKRHFKKSGNVKPNGEMNLAIFFFPNVLFMSPKLKSIHYQPNLVKAPCSLYLYYSYFPRHCRIHYLIRHSYFIAVSDLWKSPSGSPRLIQQVSDEI